MSHHLAERTKEPREHVEDDAAREHECRDDRQPHELRDEKLDSAAYPALPRLWAEEVRSQTPHAAHSTLSLSIRQGF